MNEATEASSLVVTKLPLLLWGKFIQLVELSWGRQAIGEGCEDLENISYPGSMLPSSSTLANEC